MSGILVFLLRVALAILLYSFLAFAILTLWKDMRTQSKVLSRPSIPILTLWQMDSPAEGISFTKNEVIIGRDAICDLTLADEAISGRHARMSYHHQQWWLEDLGSTNGTLLNGEKLQTAAVVENGDHIQLGTITLEITLASVE